MIASCMLGLGGVLWKVHKTMPADPSDNLLRKVHGSTSLDNCHYLLG